MVAAGAVTIPAAFAIICAVDVIQSFLVPALELDGYEGDDVADTLFPGIAAGQSHGRRRQIMGS